MRGRKRVDAILSEKCATCVCQGNVECVVEGEKEYRVGDCFCPDCKCREQFGAALFQDGKFKMVLTQPDQDPYQD